MITTGLLVAALAGFQAPSWTWTLYDGSSPIVLANERPDTPDLRSTLECEPASSVVKVTLYGSTLGTGVATVSSGDASAAVQTTAAPDGAVVAPLRTDHPVFSGFAASGSIAFVVGPNRQGLEIPQTDLAKLRRFADLCSS